MQNEVKQQMKGQPRLIDCLPLLAQELRDGLEEQDEHFLANSIEFVHIYGRCDCNDDFCATFYTAPRPDGTYRPEKRNVILNPKNGMTILRVNDNEITQVELIHRPDIRVQVQRLFAPLAKDADR